MIQQQIFLPPSTPIIKMFNFSFRFLPLLGVGLFLSAHVVANNLREGATPTVNNAIHPGYDELDDSQKLVTHSNSNNLLRRMMMLDEDNDAYAKCISSRGYQHVSEYANEILRGLSDEELAAFQELDNDLRFQSWPAAALFISMIVGTSPDPTYDFYPSRKQGKKYHKILQDMENFWEMDAPTTLYAYSADLIADLFDDQRAMENAVRNVFSTNSFQPSREFAREKIHRAKELMEAYPILGYDFPLWTFTAFALAPDTIALGDELTKYMEWAGTDDVGPDFVLFHEFGHIIQFANFSPQDFEEPPYRELMADVFAAYYGHHPRGASLQTKRLEEMAMTAYNIGACRLEDGVQHGTPNQRAAAVRFAAALIDDNRAKGFILSVQQVINLFDAAYEDILANK